MKNKVNLWWHKNDGVSNFGDVLAPYLVKKITGKEVRFQEASRWPWPKTYMVIGSILAAAKRNCEVWGAGLIDRQTKVGPAKFHAVRGPETRRMLIQQGHKVPEVYGDPAILLPKYYQPKNLSKIKFGVIPHIVDFEKVKREASKEIKVIDLTGEIENVVDEICSCDYTFSSSLHGIIVSHSYGIPSQWVEFSDKLFGDGVKFIDYFKSVGMESKLPINLQGKPLNTNELLIYVSSSSNLPSCDFDDMRNQLLKACPFI